MLKTAVNLGFYGSSVGFVVLLLIWVGKLHKGSVVDGAAAVVSLSSLTMTIVVVTLEVGFKGNARLIAKLMSKINGDDKGILNYIFCATNGVVKGYMFKGPWKTESWGFSCFTLSQATFIALYGNKKVSKTLCQALTVQQLSYLGQHLVEADYLPALACTLSFTVCLALVFFEVAGLKLNGADDEEPARVAE